MPIPQPASSRKKPTDDQEQTEFLYTVVLKILAVLRSIPNAENSSAA
jgi:hypothetical protein